MGKCHQVNQVFLAQNVNKPTNINTSSRITRNRITRMCHHADDGQTLRSEDSLRVARLCSRPVQTPLPGSSSLSPGQSPRRIPTFIQISPGVPTMCPVGISNQQTTPSGRPSRKQPVFQRKDPLSSAPP